MTRIRDTSKKQPLFDPKKVAEAFGADVVTSTIKNRARDNRCYIEIVRHKKNGRRSKKRIYELRNIQEMNKFTLLGIADGDNLFHCLYIAARHAKDFWKRVCAYSHGSEDSRGSPYYRFVVCFYEKR